jgi:Flp pilus assembly protein TadG
MISGAHSFSLVFALKARRNKRRRPVGRLGILSWKLPKGATAPRALLARALNENSGIAAVEFALLVPILITLFFGAVEVTRFILVSQKVEKLAHTVADVTAQSKTLSNAQLDQLLEATENIMEPFTTGANSRVLITSLYRASGTDFATVRWRYAGGGALSATSEFGTVGSVPTMPVAFTFNERENVIAAEVFYRFSPLVSSDFFGTVTIRRTAFYKPRLGLLTTPPV